MSSQECRDPNSPNRISLSSGSGCHPTTNQRQSQLRLPMFQTVPARSHDVASNGNDGWSYPQMDLPCMRRHGNYEMLGPKWLRNSMVGMCHATESYEPNAFCFSLPCFASLRPLPTPPFRTPVDQTKTHINVAIDRAIGGATASYRRLPLI